MVTGHSDFRTRDWRELIAVGIVANDLSALTIARCAGVGLNEAVAALENAVNEEVIVNGVVEPTEATRLVGDLSPDVVADIHTSVARHLLSDGPSRLFDALEHARSAGTLSPSGELLEIIDRAGATSLSVGDYDSARQFLEFAHDIDIHGSPSVRAQRLLRLGETLDGLGHVAEARRRLAIAFDIAEINGLVDLGVDVSVAYSMPVDWYAGDRRISAILQRADSLATSEEHRVKVAAARAMAEMRIPIPSGDNNQVAWITRPTVAQPLSEMALAGSASCGDDARLLALLAWRTTHRAPQFLATRRSMSTEAVDLSQRLRRPSRQVDAAIMLAVDALESADRPGFDHALTVIRWVSEVDGNPRLKWLAHCVAGGAAHLDGDVDAAERHRLAAREIGQAIESPGWFGAEMLLIAQEVLSDRKPDRVRESLPPDSATQMLNPLSKLIVGLGHALVEDLERAESLLRQAIRQFDPEASWLLCLTRATELAIHLDVPDIHEELWNQLEPWHAHVAIDSQAWFCDGPISGWLALLAHRRGDSAVARAYLLRAEPVARQIGDTRSIQRLSTLRSELKGFDFDGIAIDQDFTQRELTVLALAAQGSTNPQIARDLSFSVSTVRNELTSIYRKLGVSTRAEATAQAMKLGLIPAVDQA